jgi:hypothetical protein
MEKSKYGKELIYLWTGNLSHEQVSLREVPSTLIISAKKQGEIKQKFLEAKAKNPNFFDGLLWKYEGHEESQGGVTFNLSPTNYMPHNILRFENFPISLEGRSSYHSSSLHDKGLLKTRYPNPFSINALQRTLDGYLLIGVKGEKSDQVGLGVMGAGFIKRTSQEGKNLPPEDVFAGTLRESLEETSYSGNPLTEEEVREFRALGTIFGSNHDTTTCVYVPLKITKDKVGIGNKEHSALIFLEDNSLILQKFLESGGIDVDYLNYRNTIFETYSQKDKKDKMATLKNSPSGIVPSVDHLLGCIELYLRNRKSFIE